MTEGLLVSLFFSPRGGERECGSLGQKGKQGSRRGGRGEVGVPGAPRAAAKAGVKRCVARWHR